MSLTGLANDQMAVAKVQQIISAGRAWNASAGDPTQQNFWHGVADDARNWLQSNGYGELAQIAGGHDGKSPDELAAQLPAIVAQLQADGVLSNGVALPPGTGIGAGAIVDTGIPGAPATTGATGAAGTTPPAGFYSGIVSTIQDAVKGAFAGFGSILGPGGSMIGGKVGQDVTTGSGNVEPAKWDWGGMGRQLLTWLPIILLVYGLGKILRLKWELPTFKLNANVGKG